MSKRAVFVDRDNTIIHNDGDLGDPQQVRLIQGASSAIASLQGLGFMVVVVSNQGGVARGKYTEADVDKVNQRIAELVFQQTAARIEQFYYCPFHPEGTVEKYRREHPWRKPNPGMLQQAAKDLDLDLTWSWMIGDQWRDIQAGVAAGVRTVLLTDPTARKLPLAGPTVPDKPDDVNVEPDHYATNLIEAVRLIAQAPRPDLAEREAAEPPPPAKEMESDSQGSTEPAQPKYESVSASQQKQTMPANAPLFADRMVKKQQRHETPPPAPQPEPPATHESAEDTAPPPPKPVAEVSPPATAAEAPATPPTPTPPSEPQVPSAAQQQPSKAARPAVPEPPTTPPKSSQAAATSNAQSQAEREPAASSTTDASQHEKMMHMLEKIQRDVKTQRMEAGDFSMLRLGAIIAQLLVPVALLLGVINASNDVSAFTPWLGGAILVQLTTIALILFDRM